MSATEADDGSTATFADSPGLRREALDRLQTSLRRLQRYEQEYESLRCAMAPMGFNLPADVIAFCAAKLEQYRPSPGTVVVYKRGEDDLVIVTGVPVGASGSVN